MKMPPLADPRMLRATEVALDLLSEMELLRLKSLARLHARGLPPDVAWDDLLQEAVTRVLTGARRKPRELGMVAFLASVMRSLRSEHWRRAASRRVAPWIGDAGEEAQEAPPDAVADPERALSAAQQLNAIGELFADDEVALRIIVGLGEGLSPEDVRLATGLSKSDYDSARRRMRRRLLREGLTCQPK